MKKQIKKIVKSFAAKGKKSRFLVGIVTEYYYRTLSNRDGTSHPLSEKNLNEKIKKFVSADKRKDKAYIRRLKKDIIFSYFYYNVAPAPYFLFRFENLSDKGRREFVGGNEKSQFTAGKTKSSEYFKNKYKAYQMFKPYYHREMAEFCGPADEAAFFDFCGRHRTFVWKPEAEAKGRGIHFVELDKTDQDLKALYRSLTSPGGIFVAEEVIRQSEVMSALHPDSVNTVRVVTYLRGEELIPLFAMLRMGCGGNPVDNANAGGIAAGIDYESGIVNTPGCREDLTEYLCHPDTGVQIIGFNLPEWEQLKALIGELVRVIPKQRYVGWDLAYTDEGWIMVEGNGNAMVTAIQMAERRGLRDVFEKAFG